MQLVPAHRVGTIVEECLSSPAFPVGGLYPCVFPFGEEQALQVRIHTSL